MSHEDSTDQPKTSYASIVKDYTESDNIFNRWQTWFVLSAGNLLAIVAELTGTVDTLFGPEINYVAAPLAAYYFIQEWRRDE